MIFLLSPNAHHLTVLSSNFPTKCLPSRGVNHSLEISGYPCKNQKSSTSKPEILLRIKKSRTLNVEVIYPLCQSVRQEVYIVLLVADNWWRGGTRLRTFRRVCSILFSELIRQPCFFSHLFVSWCFH